MRVSITQAHLGSDHAVIRSRSELYRGLGSVVIGGLLLSTLFTLFLVPTFLSLAMDLRAWIGRVGRAM